MARFVRVRADQMMGGFDGQSFGAGRDQERRGAAVNGHLGIVDRYDDEERGDGSIGGEVLSPGDDPVIAIAYGTGGEDARIGAALGLRHRETREYLARQEPGQITVFLILGSEARDDLGVSGVRRLGPEHDRRPRAAAQNFVDQRQLDRPEALPAEFWAQMRCPQAIVADLLFEWIDNAPPLVVQRQELAAREQHFEGFDLLAYKLANPVEFLLELRFGGEVPGHRILRRLGPDGACLGNAAVGPQDRTGGE